MKKPYKVLSATALAAVLATSSLVPVIAQAAPANQIKDVIVSKDGVNYKMKQSQYDSLVDAGKVPGTVAFITSSTGKTYTINQFNNAIDSSANVDEALTKLDTTATAQNPTTVDATFDSNGNLVTTPVAGDLKVESVSAINGAQVQIKFTKPVLKSSVISGTSLNTTNVDVSAASGTNTVVPSTLNADLSADGKTLTITGDSAFKGSYSVTVKDGVVTSENEKIVPYSTAFTIDEKVAPKVTEVTSIAKGATASSVTLNYSEPVKSGAVIKVNGTQVGVTAANDISTTLTGLNLDSTKTHTIEVVNLTDLAGNVTALTSQTFTVKQDAAAPTVTSVVAQGDTHLLVTFDKKVKTSTLTNSNYSAVDASTNTAIALGNATSVSSAASDTKFLIPITTPANLFVNTNSKTLNVLFTSNIEDALGNNLIPVTKSVTLTKDVVAPKVAKVSYNKSAGTNGSLVLTFDEAINNTGSTAVPTILNPDGTENTILITAQAQAGSLSNDNKTLTIPLAAAPSASVTGDYTVMLSKGFVKDRAATPNDSVAYTGKVDFGAQATKVTVTGAAETAANSNKIQVDFSETVKGGAVSGSATDLSNYSLGGKALPEGTLIVLAGSKDFVTITLPAESIAKSDSAAILTVNNVQGTVSGATLTPYTGTVNVADNVSPILESAKVLNNKQIELTYSENIGTLSGVNVKNEFKIYEGTVAKTLGAGTTLDADNLTGYPNKVIITLGGNDSAASVTTATANTGNTGSGTLPTQSGTFTGTSDETITVTKTAGGYSINGGSDETGLTATYKGLTITFPTGAAATGDNWTFAATAAVPAKFDVSKTIEVETIANLVIKDTSALTNAQKVGIRVTATK